MSKKGRVEYIQESEPPFIRRFKERAGIVQPPTIASKRFTSSCDHDDDDGDRPDEQPQLVLNDSSGVTEDEARAFLAKKVTKQSASESNSMEKANIIEEKLDVAMDQGKKIRYRPESERQQRSNHTESSTHFNTRKASRADKTVRDRSPPSNRSDVRAGRPHGLLSFDIDTEEEV
ncbi:unnamed protein product [Dicrocoelium dendriticum]|nr:unnamed protein product [Dicrocoelium dendriticum]